MSHEIVRSINIKVFPNEGKKEDLRYSASRYVMYTQHWVTQLFFRKDVKYLSTKGTGYLSNQAQYRAVGILNVVRGSSKESGKKLNSPKIKFLACPAKIERSSNSKFDYWVDFETQFSRNKRIRIPAKSHKRLNDLLRKKWHMSEACELFLSEKKEWYARVFLKKEIEKYPPINTHLGIDVGIRNSVSRSDGYLGKGLSKIIESTKVKNAERRRQDHAVKRPKSSVKQQLDIEARRAVARCKRDGLSLAFENPKRLANLRSGSLQGWARSYFARRAAMIAEEEGIWVTHVNPAYTSQTCNSCGNRDKRNRVKSVFKCTACGSRTHADINAARVIAQKGSEIIRLRKKSGDLFKGYTH